MGSTKYILTGRLIDGTGGPVQKGRTLVVEGNRIKEIVSSERINPADSAELIDLSHCTIMPPLMDCSIDIVRSASTDRRQQSKTGEKTKEEIVADVARHIHFCHSHGVLGLADSDFSGETDVGTESRKGADSAVCIKTAGSTRLIPEEANLAGSGQTDFLRLACSVGPGKNSFNPDPDETGEYEALCRLIGKAREKGLKTVVQANGERQVRLALRAGCDAIEQGADMGEDNIKEMVARKVLWIPGLVRTLARCESAPAEKKGLEKLLKIQLAELGRARELGVSAVVGTGAGRTGIIHGEAMVEEIKLFIRAGYTLVEALCAASVAGASFFGIEGIAPLQQGGPANFIVSRGMVQQLPRKLSYLESIYVNGAPSAGYRKNPVKTVWKR